MRIDLITLFPEMLGAIRDCGVTGRAHAQGLWSIKGWNPRDYTHDIHRTVDDRPYGGGPGMVMLAEPLADTLAAVQQDRSPLGLDGAPVVLLSPTGARFDQSRAQSLAQSAGAIFVCGRYEGVDQRFIDQHVTEELSLGDFVLSGGEIAALAMVDAAVRLLPGALNDSDSARFDSFHADMAGLLDSPHYTRPIDLPGGRVPDVLMSGHHANIARWRREQSLRMTQLRRPDLIRSAREAGLLSKDDERFLATQASSPAT